MFSTLNKPSLTLAQIVALIAGALYPVLTLIGVTLDATQRDALDTLLSLAIGLFAADAVIRVGRSYGSSKVEAAKQANLATLYPPLPDEGDADAKPVV